MLLQDRRDGVSQSLTRFGHDADRLAREPYLQPTHAQTNSTTSGILDSDWSKGVGSFSITAALPGLYLMGSIQSISIARTWTFMVEALPKTSSLVIDLVKFPVGCLAFVIVVCRIGREGKAVLWGSQRKHSFVSCEVSIKRVGQTDLHKCYSDFKGDLLILQDRTILVQGERLLLLTRTLHNTTGEHY